MPTFTQFVTRITVEQLPADWSYVRIPSSAVREQVFQVLRERGGMLHGEQALREALEKGISCQQASVRGDRLHIQVLTNAQKPRVADLSGVEVLLSECQFYVD